MEQFFAPIVETFVTIPGWVGRLLFLLALTLVALMLAALTWKFYLEYIRTKFIMTIEWSTLEIKLPQDVPRSPAAMELVLNALYQGGGIGTWTAKYLKGKVLLWSSIEIISIEGRIHFILHVPEKIRDVVESQIYAQFPQAEVKEVEDYTRKVPLYEPDGDWELFSIDYKFSKDDAYPIKTYVDYGLDQATNLEDDQKIDPLTPMLEFFGTMRPGEQMWLQFMVRKSADRYPAGKGLFTKRHDWVKEGRKLVAKLSIDFAKSKKDMALSIDEEGKPNIQMLSSEKRILEAIERSLDKPGFDTGIRLVYIAKKDVYDMYRRSAVIPSNLFAPFNSSELNAIKPDGSSVTDVDYKWQDPTGKRVIDKKKSQLKKYMQREFFYTGGIGKKPIVLNSEELATIFHFPGRISVTPGLQSVQMRRAEPPTNLPGV